MSVLEGAEVKRADQVTLARGSAAASVPSSAPVGHPPRGGELNVNDDGPGRTAYEAERVLAQRRSL